MSEKIRKPRLAIHDVHDFLVADLLAGISQRTKSNLAPSMGGAAARKVGIKPPSPSASPAKSRVNLGVVQAQTDQAAINAPSARSSSW